MRKKAPTTVEEWAGDAGQYGQDNQGKFISKQHKGQLHSDQRNAALMAKAMQMRWVNHMTMPEIARALQVPQNRIEGWLKPFKVIMENPQEVREFKKYEANVLDGIRYMALKGMVTRLSDPEYMAKVDLSRLTYNYGVLYDKTRLERGQSTENVLSLSELVKAAHAKTVEPEEAEVVESKEVVPA